jgi:hypothetical protein
MSQRVSFGPQCRRRSEVKTYVSTAYDNQLLQATLQIPAVADLCIFFFHNNSASSSRCKPGSLFLSVRIFIF